MISQKEIEQLEPIDPKKCQAEVISYHPMRFGGNLHETKRCEKTPVWIALDYREGEFYGGMALCDDCKKICEIQIKTCRFQKLLEE